MDATHARPMTAYAALCAAAVVVLAQGVSRPSPVADAIAQAGPPALRYAQTVTLAATEQVRDLGTAVAATSVAPVLAATQARSAGTGREDDRQTLSGSATTQVAEPVKIEPAVRDLAPATSTQVHGRAGHHKADRASARDARKAHRGAAKDTRKAHRSARQR